MRLAEDEDQHLEGEDTNDADGDQRSAGVDPPPLAEPRDDGADDEEGDAEHGQFELEEEPLYDRQYGAEGGAEPERRVDTEGTNRRVRLAHVRADVSPE